MTVQQNVAEWSNYGWEMRGSEWSHNWGGDDALWHAAVYPRIRAFLPCLTALEIGCGHGRMTRYLARECSRIIGFDVAAPCVDYCQQKFPHHSFHLGNGKTFPRSSTSARTFNSFYMNPIIVTSLKWRQGCLDNSHVRRIL